MFADGDCPMSMRDLHEAALHGPCVADTDFRIPTETDGPADGIDVKLPSTALINHGGTLVARRASVTRRLITVPRPGIANSERVRAGL